MTADDGGLPFLVGETLESSHVLLHGLPNHLRSILGAAAPYETVDGIQRLFVYRDRYCFHIVKHII